MTEYRMGDQFGQALAEFYSALLAKQQPLGAEFEKVLQDNLWDLYVRSGQLPKKE